LGAERPGAEHSRIPLVDLVTQTRTLRAELDEAVRRVLDSGRFVLGAELQSFETEFAAEMGAAQAVGVNSGTDALVLALKAAGVGPGDEVVTVANTFTATAMAIRLLGARCVLVDCDETALIDIAALAKAVSQRTRAIIPVHLYGQPVDIDSVLEIANGCGAAVIQDACQAHGATYAGRPLGGLGTAACYSFYPSKNLGAAGDGGAVVTNDGSIADRLRLLRDFGGRENSAHELVGTNSRLDELQAAILRVKLAHLGQWNDARRRIAARYITLLDGSAAEPVVHGPGADHVWHLFVVRVPDRSRVRSTLARAGIETGIHYPVPVHLQSAHADLGYRHGAFPVTERLAGQILSLPMYAELPEVAVERVCEALLSAIN
jgi:dTDP-4-amino-4,6-dideoxygalactose transaminase